MDSAQEQSDVNSIRDIDAAQTTAYLKGLIACVVNTLPVVEVECHHSKINQTDVLQLETRICAEKERNIALNQQLIYECIQANDQVVPVENVDATLEEDRMARYRTLLLALKSVHVLYCIV